MLAALRRYRLPDLPHDVAGGLAVAAVTVPVSIANAQLAGLPPEHGLYASVLPLVIYSLLGTSRQLIVGTSAATAALIASAVGTLGAADPSQHLAFAMMLTLLVGLMCLAASLLRLGAIADVLSRPIIVGFMNGVALNLTEVLDRWVFTGGARHGTAHRWTTEALRYVQPPATVAAARRHWRP